MIDKGNRTDPEKVWSGPDSVFSGPKELRDYPGLTRQQKIGILRR